MLSGFSLGMAALAWAGMVYVPFVFLFYMLVKGFREARISFLLFLFMAGFLIPTASWSIYASYKANHKILISSASTIALTDGLIRHDYSKLRKYPTVQRAIAQKERRALLMPRDYYLFYKSELKNFPLDFVRWGAYKASRAWYGTDAEKHEGLNLLIQIPYLLLGFFGLFYLIVDHKKETYLLLLLVLYFWGITFFALTTIRYMMPAFMLWMVFAGYGIHSLLRKAGH